jgi:2-oxoglutarate ferredoxin oxidoreductase subunit gamma
MGRTEILIGGFGGQGILLAGYIIGRAAVVHENKESVFIPNYGPEARGGASVAEIIIDEKPIDYPYVSAADVFAVMSQEAYDKYISRVKENGILIYDEDLVKVDERSEKLRVYKIPATRLAESIGKKIVANIILLGFLTSITKLVSYTAMKKSISERVSEKFIDINFKAFDIGYNYKSE